MPQENKSEIFIRLLGDAVQADRLLRKSVMSLTHKTSAKRIPRIFQPDIDDAVHASGPLDCVQMMASGWPDPQNG
jgi:hypothetical protein